MTPILTSNTVIAYKIGNNITVNHRPNDTDNWYLTIPQLRLARFQICPVTATKTEIARLIYTILNDPIYADNKHTDKLMSEVIPFTI